MTADQRAAVVHMLLAQREQINATLRLLAEEHQAEKRAEEKPRPRFLGDTPTTEGET